jgi:type VI secretion system protein ImpK
MIARLGPCYHPAMLSTFISVKTRMPDLCADVWNYAFSLRGTTPRPEDVKSRIASLFRALDKQARLAGAEQADVQLAKFALCAWLDELVMATAMAHAWTPLCQEYFGDANAGETFYTRLESLRHSDETRKRDLLEVYYLCLALGFAGMLGSEGGAERRKVLLEGLCRELRGERARPLSVQISSPDALPGPRRDWPAWAVPLLCMLLLGVLYAALAFALAEAA